MKPNQLVSAWLFAAILLGTANWRAVFAQSAGSGGSCDAPSPPITLPNIDWSHIWDNITPQAQTTESVEPIYGYAHDPNQKIVLAGVGGSGYVKGSALLPYRIDFQNETNATAPAQQVFITDQLASTLDWSAFELTEIQFGDCLLALPPNTQHFATNLSVTFSGTSFTVQIEAGIRLSGGQVFATFRSVDPATDLPPPTQIGFLPPDDGFGRGQGHVAFLIRPKAGLATGTQIRNVALVDFANGEVIATDQVAEHDPSQGTDPTKQARVTIDAGAPTSSVTALPSHSPPSFLVQWSGKDDTGGSGIATYDILSSTNKGSFGPWFQGTTNTSATFTGTVGNAYAFYSIARDNVGNVEAAPNVPDTQTTVVNGGPVAVDDTLTRPATGEFQIPASTLLANDSDIGGHPLTVTSVSPTSAQGASVTLVGNVIHYLPPTGFTNSDSFSYTIGDGTGATASATVTLNVIPPIARPVLKLTGIEETPNGRKIHFAGLPGVAYTIQVSNDLISWSLLDTQTADPTGAYSIVDPDSSASARFYRAVVP